MSERDNQNEVNRTVSGWATPELHARIKEHKGLKYGAMAMTSEAKVITHLIILGLRVLDVLKPYYLKGELPKFKIVVLK